MWKHPELDLHSSADLKKQTSDAKPDLADQLHLEWGA